MEYVVTIRPYVSNHPLLIINEELAEKLNLIKKKRGYVSFGTQKNYVDIKISQKLDTGEISLSTSIISNLHIPDYPILEVRVKGNEIAIGPCIGILASHKDKDITKRRLKNISLNTKDYQRIHGAIIVFALDKVSISKRLVEGYCYNPKTDTWERGIFPYPLSIYWRTGLDIEWQNHFLSVIGDTVFNNYSFDKWEMNEWFSKEPEILPHLPCTRLYESKQDIYDMLLKYPALYIKPIWGMKGFGVVKASLDNDMVVFKYRENDEDIVISAKDEEEFEEAVEKLFKRKNHIIQQGLDLLSYNGGVVDFRCVMQKNAAANWICNAIVGRIGAAGSVVSNISSGGAALPGIELISEALSLSEFETFDLKEKMTSLCMKVCRTLDEYGINYGSLGLDLGVDKNMNIWLIEVNNRRPHPAIALRVNDIPSYYTILASPLHYAKALSGFGCKEEDSNVL